MRSLLLTIAASTFGALSQPVLASELKVEVLKLDSTGTGASLGYVSIAEGDQGLVFKPALNGLAPGLHGFHVHELPNCASGEKDGKTVAGLAAGNHFDPAATGRHAGPAGDGHLGDLPVLSVSDDGSASDAVTAPRLKLADVQGKSLIIHAENDNYADKLGGARIACGVIR
ncbi:superoxide dismutase family protein [Methylococcus sp. EFPC2]|uniref:superoxide dismutase family protein n=1 Tax=Methylococcus sp. EFPC2 TaxID=2812648 RepID=UPI0019678BD3|nr:superoxide dismutase family protein [Methylococcus sp. EFPC2]QSA95502.1 superoxide dismutase family protein [Methylococcus sp. EFPC2]